MVVVVCVTLSLSALLSLPPVLGHSHFFYRAPLLTQDSPLPPHFLLSMKPLRERESHVGSGARVKWTRGQWTRGVLGEARSCYRRMEITQDREGWVGVKKEVV